jgi:hypothetical protein
MRTGISNPVPNSTSRIQNVLPHELINSPLIFRSAIQRCMVSMDECVTQPKIYLPTEIICKLTEENCHHIYKGVIRL